MAAPREGLTYRQADDDALAGFQNVNEPGECRSHSSKTPLTYVLDSAPWQMTTLTSRMSETKRKKSMTLAERAFLVPPSFFFICVKRVCLQDLRLYRKVASLKNFLGGLVGTLPAELPDLSFPQREVPVPQYWSGRANRHFIVARTNTVHACCLSADAFRNAYGRAKWMK